MNRKIISHSADYIKRQAKSIKKKEGISHAKALDQSAVNCGYHNWTHFLNSNKEENQSEQPNVMNPYRKLLVAGVNKLLSENLISLDAKNKKYVNAGHIITELLGYTTVIMWEEAGFEELRVSVWWKYDHSFHPQANLTGNTRERFTLEKPLAKRQHYKKFVGIVTSGWLERRNGKHIQGEKNRALFGVYTRKGEKELLEGIPDPMPNGFKSEGKFRF